MKKPYVIASPEFDVTSGGIRVMWGLFGWLLAKGQVAYMNRYPEGETIAIYPEIFHGNRMNGKTVVRYILNTPGLMGSRTLTGFSHGPTEFDPTDKLYYFSRVFGEAKHENNYLFLPVLDLHTFKDEKGLRPNTCYFIGKGINRGVHPNNAILIDREVARDQKRLADILNSCHTMWCYDDLSAMMEIARLCGCKVKYLGAYDKFKLSLYEPGTEGIIFPYMDDVQFSSDTFRQRYMDMVTVFSKKLDIFIEETQL